MSHRAESGLALLLATAVTAAVLAGRRSAPSAPELDLRTSTFLSGPRGSKALYEVLARLGWPVERRRTPLFDLARDPARRPALLAVLNPPLRLVPAELDQVVRYLRRGGAVLAAGSGGGITRCLGWQTENSGKSFLADSFRVMPPARGLELPRVADFLKPRDAASSRDEAQGAVAEACRPLSAAGQDTLLRLRDGRPVVLRLRYPGGGSVILAADAGYFRNQVWRSTAVPYFVAPLVLPDRGGRPGRISWDEYHQGFGGRGSLGGATLDWLLGTPGGWALLQLVAVVLVALAVSAVRFGPPRRVIEVRRRSPLEHVEALAAGLEGAAGVDTAVALVISGLRRRLSRTGHVPRGGEPEWLSALELALPTARGRDAVRRLQRIATQPGGGERALAAAQAAEDVWEELGQPGMRGAF